MSTRSRYSRILVTEDHDAQLETIVALLREEGYEVVGCKTAADTITQAQQQRFDIALIDLQLPDQQGISVIEQLRANNRRLQIIINTGFSSLDTAKEAINLGVMAYIEKGSDPKELLHQIDRAILNHLDQYTEELERAVADRTASLQERDEQFCQLAENIHEVFWLSTPCRRQLLYVSPAYATIWGQSCQSLLNNPLSFQDFIHPEDRPHMHRALTDTILTESCNEYRILRPGNQIRWIRERTFPVKDAEGDIYRLAGLWEDMTDQKEAETALRETQQKLHQSQKMEAIGTLAGGIAHDFNNILAAILGYTELSMLRSHDQEKVSSYLHEIQLAGKRAKHLVQQILAFSHQQKPERKPLHLGPLIEEGLQLLRASLPTTITIVQDLRAQYTILADPTQIHQVLFNLCANAEHAMRETGGTLTVTLEDLEVSRALTKQHPDLQVGPYLRLTIQDTGHGIPQTLVPKIFDPYFTTKNIGEGTGLGLSVIHGIVTSHGGAISVSSRIGEGTTVEVYFPQVLEYLEPPTQTILPLVGGTATILFVDDEEPLARLGAEWLTQLGYTTVISTSSIEALALFRQDPLRFDLIVTDQTMPNMSGELLARELLTLRPDLPIILCTGFSHTMSPEKARSLGIRDFLMKPLTYHDLGHAIRKILDG
ncbi:MAG: response regulator [Nitrospirae bacterium]|nr:response regulator [Nitrospirota bacterium]MDA1303225.1 response regulator [Nitrospirota bacterium]